MPRFRPAPALEVSTWVNTSESLTLEALRGRVVVLHAFQMLCPGCVELATPQAQRAHEFFSRDEVAVVGLHCVFENHDAQSPQALERYVAEHRLTFPIGVDQPDGRGGIPLTMRALNLDGTPTLVLLDRHGSVRMKRLGHVPDLELGAAIATLLAEPR
ncbi:MAG TPA: TlpA disulfide reductase family protein [Burkholderiales bacterium]|nr:TlpA disulfide reductase family protein [Burkholderiales bacterium]